VVNQGTIAADTSGGTIYLLGQSVTNLGSLQATAGTLTVTGLTGNIGAATITGGGTLDLSGIYVNEQNRSVINSTLIFCGAWTNTASIALSNATFSTRGTWRNSGSIQRHQRQCRLRVARSRSQIWEHSIAMQGRFNSPAPWTTGGGTVTFERSLRFMGY
jgi:hypothetical protein